MSSRNYTFNFQLSTFNLVLTDLENYDREELTTGMLKAQLIVLVYIIPFIIIFGIPYYLIWGPEMSAEEYSNSLSVLGAWKTPIIIGVIIIAIIIHEILHGITWAHYASNGLKSIRYGVAWKFLTPYCHCSELLSVKHYITGAAMPGIILGIIPTVISMFTGNIVLFVFGMFMIFGAGGDLMIIHSLRKERMDSLVQDHPSKIGCYIYRPKLI